MCKRVVFLLCLVSFSAVAKHRTNEFVVIDEEMKNDCTSKSKKFFKRKIQDLKEDIVFTSIHSLEALHAHIAREVTLLAKGRGDAIAILNRISQYILALSRQIIEQEKDCFMADASSQALVTLHTIFQEIERSIGRSMDIEWIITQEKNIIKICGRDILSHK
ncbi:hypothetical protein A3F06_03975 [candidate division TM6 bacterium RIFCSPHIGHO2_12_FULL_36_22]|nr:MAG: hypothetical protein A3F06_03975 [candidate division TM6 bacterium RIFCSPHIGHO2_12_FULL_36_22]